jgi:hypothetical protein
MQWTYHKTKSIYFEICFRDYVIVTFDVKNLDFREYSL